MYAQFAHAKAGHILGDMLHSDILSSDIALLQIQSDLTRCAPPANLVSQED
jgi:aspartate carbamoyltransferase catalytic subunit